MSLEKVFNRKQVKEEAEKIPLTLGQMQEMFNDYGIRVFNTETRELEIATMHTATTADLLSVIKYYEDNLTKVEVEPDENIVAPESQFINEGFGFNKPKDEAQRGGKEDQINARENAHNHAMKVLDNYITRENENAAKYIDGDNREYHLMKAKILRTAYRTIELNYKMYLENPKAINELLSTEENITGDKNHGK